MSLAYLPALAGKTKAGDAVSDGCGGVGCCRQGGLERTRHKEEAKEGTQAEASEPMRAAGEEPAADRACLGNGGLDPDGRKGGVKAVSDGQQGPVIHDAEPRKEAVVAALEVPRALRLSCRGTLPS